MIWLLASLFGKYVTVGLPSVNALVAAFVLYVAADRIGLLRGFGSYDTESAVANAAPQQRV